MSRSEEQIQDCQGTMNFTTLLLFTDIFYLPKHQTYSNTGRPPVFLRWHNNQLQRVLYFFFRNCSYLHTVSATLFFQFFSSISCISSIVSCMHTVQSCVNSVYRTWILSGVSFNLRSFSHLYYRVNPFVPLITSKFISKLQVVQSAVNDYLSNKNCKVISSILSWY